VNFVTVIIFMPLLQAWTLPEMGRHLLTFL